MAELQSFGNAVSMVETAAPRNLGSDLQDAAASISGVIGTAQSVVAGAAKRRASQLELQQESALAQGNIVNEEFKRREPLAEALESGQLTQSQVANFGVDEQASLAALNQAAGQGMGTSVKNALERSVRFQFAAMKNPGAAKELAAAYGIGNNSVEQDTLDALEKVERQQLEEDADQVREMAAAEGYTEFLNKSNEDVLDMWVGSPAAVREREIKQNERSALAQESSIAERAPSASRAMSLQISGISRGLNKIQGDYLAANGTGNTGTDGSVMSMAEQMNLYADDQIAQVARTYSDFPNLVKSYADGIRLAVSQRLESRKKGIDQGTQEYNAQVKRPIELANLQADLERTLFTNSQNPTRALQTSFNLATSIQDQNIKVARLRDEVLNTTSLDPAPHLIEYLKDDPSGEKLATHIAASEIPGTFILQRMLDGDAANAREARDTSIASLSALARQGGIAGNEGKMKRIVADFAVAHEYNMELSPAAAAEMETSVLKLATDTKFVAMSKNSPALRKITVPYAEGLKKKILGSMQDNMNKVTTDRVSSVFTRNLPGSKETKIGLWRKMGQYMVLDEAMTNKAGVPQYSLVGNVEEALSTKDIAAQQAVLDEYNNDLVTTTDPNEYTLLSNLTGSPDVASAITSIIESSEGISLETLSPKRTIEDRAQEDITADRFAVPRAFPRSQVE